MNTEAKTSPSRHIFAWLVSLLTIPFGLLFSGIFINAYQIKLPENYKYIPALIAGAALYFVSPALCMIYLTLALLVGIFQTEFKSTMSLFKSGLTAVGIVSFVYLVISMVFIQLGQLDWKIIQDALTWGMIELTNKGLFDESALVAQKDISLISYQVPSIVCAVFALALFVSVIFEKSVLKLFYKQKSSLTGRLSYFKVPDYLVWVFIASLALAFIDFKLPLLKLIALNVLNVCVIAYFFQGFAILFNFFEVFKVGMFTKVIMVLCMVVQLPFVTVIIGVLDYWFNFRGRFLRKATQVKERSGL